MPQRSILVADDIENQTDSGKERSQAMRSAATSLAKQLKTGIDLLYVEDLNAYPHDRFDSPRVRAWHTRHRENLNEAGRRYQVPARCLIQGGSPPEQILKALRAKPAPEFVVMGTQGLKGMKRFRIGSVAEEVVRHAQRPVMVVGPAAQKKDQELTGPWQLRILVATDLGKNSRAAEQYALSLAKRIEARVVLFHCLWDSYSVVLDNSAVSGVPVNFDEITVTIREAAVESMKRKALFFQKYGVPCEYKVEDKARRSSSAVYEESNDGYSLVIMGTHGRNALLNAFFGSTARETILNAAIPVIIVHSGI